jgi:hypothetical protein
MGSHNSRVCIWSHYDRQFWETTGIRPKCDYDHHEHLSRTDALGLVQSLIRTGREPETGKTTWLFEASWVEGHGLRKNSVIILNNPLEWVIRQSEGGYYTHQLRPVGQ